MPDLKVYVNSDPNAPKREAEVLQRRASRRPYRRSSRKREPRVEAANRRADGSRSRRFQQEYPAKLQFSYGTPKYEKPFLVRSIWHDGQFTYIKSDASRTAGAVRNEGRQAGARQLPGAAGHLRRAEGRWSEGYLALGKERFTFARRGGDVWKRRPPSQHSQRRAPAAAPAVTDRRPSPRGVLPRGVQTWLMAGLAVVHAADHVRGRSAGARLHDLRLRPRRAGAECRPRARLPGPSARARGAEPCAVGRSTGGSRRRPSEYQRTVRAAAGRPDCRRRRRRREVRKPVCQQRRAEPEAGVTAT